MTNVLTTKFQIHAQTCIHTYKCLFIYSDIYKCHIHVVRSYRLVATTVRRVIATEVNSSFCFISPSSVLSRFFVLSWLYCYCSHWHVFPLSHGKRPFPWTTEWLQLGARKAKTRYEMTRRQFAVMSHTIWKNSNRRIFITCKK